MNKTIKPKPKEELEKENTELRDRIKRLEREVLEEGRVIRLLLAADLVAEDKVEQARSLAQSLR